MTSHLYDGIGAGYGTARRPDRHILSQVVDALGDARSVIDIGAGTGNYEPADRRVLAVELSRTMINQRSGQAPAVQSFAETLPVADDSFDAALAMFTIHHWSDREAGLAEMRRVSRRQVSLVYDEAVSATYWLLDYFPRVWPKIAAPSPEWIGSHLRLVETRPLMISNDCTDGFSGAYWNRPECYLDPRVQAGMSVLARLPEAVRERGAAALSADLESGRWDARYGYLRDMKVFDIGYRLAITER